MSELLSRASKLADQAEIYEEKSWLQSVSFQSNKLKEISRTEQQATTLRIIKDGKLGSAQSSKPGSDDVLLEYAQNTVNFGGSVAYGWPGQSNLGSPVVYDPRVETVSQQEMLELASDLVSALNSFDPSIMAMAGVSKELSQRSLKNSAGFVGLEKSTLWKMYFGGELVNDEGFLFVYDQFIGSNYSGDIAKLKERVIESFRLAKNIVPLKAGQYPVVFAPAEVGTLINPLLACLNGKAIARGFSPFKGRLGDTLLDPRLTLIDDAHVDGAAGSSAFDREGTPTAHHLLIEAGRINNYLLDLQSASELGLKPTGNGSLDGPVPNNVILSQGNLPYAEMIKGIDEGVLIDMTMGAWAGNPYGGQISGNISLGYKIEKGQLVGRIKDSMFSLNIFEDLRNNLGALSQEQVWKGQYCFPYVQLNGVNVSTKS